jgi:hypothetical protein
LVFNHHSEKNKKQLRTTTVKLTPVQPEPLNQNRTNKTKKKNEYTISVQKFQDGLFSFSFSLSLCGIYCEQRLNLEYNEKKNN